MDCARCLFRRTNGQRLDATQENAGAERISRASSSQGDGLCCGHNPRSTHSRPAMARAPTRVRAMRLSRNLRGLCSAVTALCFVRKAPRKDALVTLSAADPLNLQGILTPGPRTAALTANRILFRDGLPLAALEAGEIRKLSQDSISDLQVETALKVGKLRASLRPYYK